MKLNVRLIALFTCGRTLLSARMVFQWGLARSLLAASLFVRRVRVLPYNNIAAKEHDADPKAEARRAELKEVQDEVCRAERSAEPKCTAKMQSRFQQSSKRVGG